PPDAAAIQTRLHEVARLLRAGVHLDAAVQQEVADLLDELSKAIQPAGSPSAETLHVAQTATHLVQQLQRPQEIGLIELTKKRLHHAVAGEETKAPQVAKLAGRILDALANIGI